MAAERFSVLGHAHSSLLPSSTGGSPTAGSRGKVLIADGDRKSLSLLRLSPSVGTHSFWAADGADWVALSPGFGAAGRHDARQKRLEVARELRRRVLADIGIVMLTAIGER